MYCLLLGLGVGLLSSFLGIGGGILIVPLLPGIANIGAKEAVATSLMTVLLVSSKNVYSFSKKSLVPFKPALSIGLGAAIATFIVSQLLAKAEDKVLLWVLALVIFIVSCRMLFWRTPRSFQKESSKNWSIKAGIIGIGVGALVGFTGIGGGILFGPILIGLNLVRDEEMSPASNLAMAISSFTACLGFIFSSESLSLSRWGYIHVDLALIIFASAWLSSHLGLSFQHKIPSNIRRSILGVVLLFVFAKTLFRVINA